MILLIVISHNCGSRAEACTDLQRIMALANGILVSWKKITEIVFLH